MTSIATRSRSRAGSGRPCGGPTGAEAPPTGTGSSRSAPTAGERSVRSPRGRRHARFLVSRSSSSGHRIERRRAPDRHAAAGQDSEGCRRLPALPGDAREHTCNQPSAPGRPATASAIPRKIIATSVRPLLKSTMSAVTGNVTVGVFTDATSRYAFERSPAFGKSIGPAETTFAALGFVNPFENSSPKQAGKLPNGDPRVAALRHRRRPEHARRDGDERVVGAAREVRRVVLAGLDQIRLVGVVVRAARLGARGGAGGPRRLPARREVGEPQRRGPRPRLVGLRERVLRLAACCPARPGREQRRSPLSGAPASRVHHRTASTAAS